MNDTTILLVGHGSRNRDGNDEIRHFAAQWRNVTRTGASNCASSSTPTCCSTRGLDRAAPRPAGAGAALILNAAGHVKMDIPAAIAAARASAIRRRLRLRPPPGHGPRDLRRAQGQLDRLMRARWPCPTRAPPASSCWAAARPTPAPTASMARWPAGCSRTATTSWWTWPSPASPGRAWNRVVQRQVRLGMTQIWCVPVYLFTGVLMERIQAQVARLRGQYPQIAFALGTHFGFDKGIFALLDAARTAASCPKAGCSMRRLQAYRRPPPKAHTCTTHSHGATPDPRHHHHHARHPLRPMVAPGGDHAIMPEPAMQPTPSPNSSPPPARPSSTTPSPSSTPRSAPTPTAPSNGRSCAA
jgi:sirohydrochlorin cobaltochelatase